MLALIEQQPKDIADQLCVARVINNSEYPRYTIADRETGQRIGSRIQSVEVAEIYFTEGCWNEGKPGVDESFTEYGVGAHEITVPDNWEPERYM